MNTLLRALALTVPPIRRLYDFARQQAAENQERACQNQAIAHELDSYRQREQHLLAELSLAAEERDALELQLYVLRSDHQRAAVHNQELSHALHAVESRLKQLDREVR